MQLESALRKAEEANEAKSQFLATMSHELRTPLNAIIGFSDMIASGVLGRKEDALTKAKEYAADVGSSGQVLLSLVNDILDLSAIEAGKRPINMEEIDLEPVVARTVHDFHYISEEKGITLNFSSEPISSKVYADKRAVYQIIMNLVSNSLKFTPAGGQIRVSVSRQGDKAIIEISDTGIGIEEEKLQNIFEPFSHSQSDPEIASQGAGLGLSIVKGLVDQHDGDLSVTSAPGAGTTFRVGLRLVTEQSN